MVRKDEETLKAEQYQAVADADAAGEELDVEIKSEKQAQRLGVAPQVSGSCDNCENDAVLETDGVAASVAKWCITHVPDNLRHLLKV